MPKLFVNGIPVEIGEVFINEFCEQMKENNIDVAKEDEWTVKAQVIDLIKFRKTFN